MGFKWEFGGISVGVWWDLNGIFVGLVWAFGGNRAPGARKWDLSGSLVGFK